MSGILLLDFLSAIAGCADSSMATGDDGWEPLDGVWKGWAMEFKVDGGGTNVDLLHAWFGECSTEFGNSECEATSSYNCEDSCESHGITYEDDEPTFEYGNGWGSFSDERTASGGTSDIATDCGCTIESLTWQVDWLGAWMALSDGDNFRLAGSLSLPSVEIRELSDVEISWADVTSDLSCQDFDPVEDVNWAYVFWFGNSTQDQVTELLSSGIDSMDLLTRLKLVSSVEVGSATSARLSEFGLFGAPSEVDGLTAEGSGTWLVTISTGSDPLDGVRTAVFLEPSSTSAVDSVQLPDGCGALEYAVDLQSASPVASGAVVDWSDVSEDGLGNPLVLEDVSALRLAFYDDSNAADVESQMLRGSLVPSTIWQADTLGSTWIYLDQLEDEDGGPFEGFADTGGTWLLSLEGGGTFVPLPLFMAVVEP